MKWVRVVTLSFLFLTTPLIPTKSLSFIVQGQSAPPTLEGTQYAEPSIFLPSLLGYTLSKQSLHTKYIFEKQGRVICRITTIQQPEIKTEFKWNDITRRNEYVTEHLPGAITSINQIGTYTQVGNVIRLEFDDRYIEASVKSAGLEGIVTVKASNEKNQWAAIKSSDTRDNSSSSSEVSKSKEPGVGSVDELKAIFAPPLGEADNQKKTESASKSEEPNLVADFVTDLFKDWQPSSDLDNQKKTEPRLIPNLEGVWAGKIWQEPGTAENTNCAYTIKLEQDGNNATGKAIIDCIDRFAGKVMGEFEIAVTVTSNGLHYKDLFITKSTQPSRWCIKEGKLYYDSRKNRLYGATQGYALIHGVRTPCQTIAFDLYRKQ